MHGLDTTVIKRLSGNCAKILYLYWGENIATTKARLQAEKMFDAAVEHFASLRSPAQITHMLAERVPWTAPVPNEAILALFNTLIQARAMYLQKNEPPKRLESALVVVIQRYIDLSRGTDTGDARRRARPPNKEERALLAEEAAQEEARRQVEQMEQEQNEYNDEDELKENFDYPAHEDAGEHTNETDP